MYKVVGDTVGFAIIDCDPALEYIVLEECECKPENSETFGVYSDSGDV